VSWKLQWQWSALRDLARLDRPLRERILAKLAAVMGDPLRHFTQLQGNRMLWKLRVGDHRLVAQVVIRERTVEVRAIEHRSTVYDR
jgi:mRNA-degrading endonuclease RelE of RelBE toxin-antitoxin system